MKIKVSTQKWEDLPEVITPLDYAAVLGIGEHKARETFNSKNFPRVPGTGIKQLAYRDAARAYSEGKTNFSKTNNNDEVVELLTEIKELLTTFTATYSSEGGKTNEKGY